MIFRIMVVTMVQLVFSQFTFGEDNIFDVDKPVIETKSKEAPHPTEPTTQPVALPIVKTTQPSTRSSKIDLLKGLNVKKSTIDGEWQRKENMIGVLSEDNATDRVIKLFDKSLPEKYTLIMECVPKGTNAVLCEIAYGGNPEKSITAGFNIYYKDAMAEQGSKGRFRACPIVMGTKVKIQIDVDKSGVAVCVSNKGKDVKVDTKRGVLGQARESMRLIDLVEEGNVAIFIRTRATIVVTSAILTTE
jgi:hypothetical protein